MKNLITVTILEPGKTIEKILFSQEADDEKYVQQVQQALDIAYRHVENAQRRELPKVTITTPTGLLPFGLNAKEVNGLHVAVIGNPSLGDTQRTRRTLSYRHKTPAFAPEIKLTPAPVRVRP